MVTWDAIKVECDGYRAGFVRTFRKYEGQQTDRKDPQGRPLKVSAKTFADIVVGVSHSAFLRWIKNAEMGAPLSGRPAGGVTGPATSGQMGRQFAKSPSVAVEDKVGMLKDLMSDKKVIKAWREDRAPIVSEHDHKAAEAAVEAFTHKLGQSFTGLEVPMWLDQLKAITKSLVEYEYDEETIAKLARVVRKLMDEIEIQQFRLGLIEEVQ